MLLLLLLLLLLLALQSLANVCLFTYKVLFYLTKLYRRILHLRLLIAGDTQSVYVHVLLVLFCNPVVAVRLATRLSARFAQKWFLLSTNFVLEPQRLDETYIQLAIQQNSAFPLPVLASSLPMPYAAATSKMTLRICKVDACSFGETFFGLAPHTFLILYGARCPSEHTANFDCINLRTSSYLFVDSSWNVMAHGDAREGKWRGNWRMEWVASTLHTTLEHDVCSITTADAHTSAASSRLNWHPRRFKWTRPFRRKTKSGFCACAITFQLASTCRLYQTLSTSSSRATCRHCSYVDRGNIPNTKMSFNPLPEKSEIQHRTNFETLWAIISLWRYIRLRFFRVFSSVVWQMPG
jgi:hypothetical protein